MFVNIYWITSPTLGRLGIMARPRGNDWLEDEIRLLALSGVEVLVSLLTEAEMVELGLVDEDRYCAQQQITYMSFPIWDRQTPPLTENTFATFHQLAHLLEQGKTVVIHCRMGIGRAALAAASVLALCGVSSEAAFGAIATARGCSVPDTVEQQEWVEHFCRHYRSKAV
jgi:protein-tyrosine phosphatase